MIDADQLREAIDNPVSPDQLDTVSTVEIATERATFAVRQARAAVENGTDFEDAISELAVGLWSEGLLVGLSLGARS